MPIKPVKDRGSGVTAMASIFPGRGRLLSEQGLVVRHEPRPRGYGHIVQGPFARTLSDPPGQRVRRKCWYLSQEDQWY